MPLAIDPLSLITFAMLIAIWFKLGKLANVNKIDEPVSPSPVAQKNKPDWLAFGTVRKVYIGGDKTAGTMVYFVDKNDLNKRRYEIHAPTKIAEAQIQQSLDTDNKFIRWKTGVALWFDSLTYQPSDFAVDYLLINEGIEFSKPGYLKKRSATNEHRRALISKMWKQQKI